MERPAGWETRRRSSTTAAELAHCNGSRFYRAVIAGSSFGVKSPVTMVRRGSNRVTAQQGSAVSSPRPWARLYVIDGEWKCGRSIGGRAF